MTLFSTITYERPTTSALAKPVVIASIAVALTVGIGLGFLVSNIDATSAAQETREFSALSHEQFLRMNTTDLELFGASATDQANAANVRSQRGLAAAVEGRAGVGSHFYEMNTTGLGSAVADTPSPAAGGAIVGNSEPFGHPNYGRLETYLGSQATGGVR